MLDFDDPYFAPEYARVNELVEGGVADTFRYTDSQGSMEHTFIVRPIHSRVIEKPLFDIISPYGYGGPRLRPVEPADALGLANSAMAAFSDYCHENDIVSEFIRFHPFEASARLLTGEYDIKRLRTTVVTDLTGENPLVREFAKNARKRIRRNARVGIETAVSEAPASLDSLIAVYQSTMERNDAESFYFFDDSYFDALVELMRERILLVEAHYLDKVIAAAVCLVGASRIHIHLSGTDTDFLHLSPAYSLRGTIAEWGIENGFECIHHGGGRTDSPDDSLYKYKRQFGQSSADFFVGKRIWNRVAFDELTRESGDDPTGTDFFPAYRRRRGK